MAKSDSQISVGDVYCHGQMGVLNPRARGTGKITCSYHNVPWLVFNEKHGVFDLVRLLRIQMLEHTAKAEPKRVAQRTSSTREANKFLNKRLRHRLPTRVEDITKWFDNNCYRFLFPT